MYHSIYTVVFNFGFSCTWGSLRYCWTSDIQLLYRNCVPGFFGFWNRLFPEPAVCQEDLDEISLTVFGCVWILDNPGLSDLSTRGCPPGQQSHCLNLLLLFPLHLESHFWWLLLCIEHSLLSGAWFIWWRMLKSERHRFSLQVPHPVVVPWGSHSIAPLQDGDNSLPAELRGLNVRIYTVISIVQGVLMWSE